MSNRPVSEHQPQQQQPAAQSAVGTGAAAAAGTSQYASTGYDDMSGYGGQQYGGAFAQVAGSTAVLSVQLAGWRLSRILLQHFLMVSLINIASVTVCLQGQYDAFGGGAIGAGAGP